MWEPSNFLYESGRIVLVGIIEEGNEHLRNLWMRYRRLKDEQWGRGGAILVASGTGIQVYVSELSTSSLHRAHNDIRPGGEILGDDPSFRFRLFQTLFEKTLSCTQDQVIRLHRRKNDQI